MDIITKDIFKDFEKKKNILITDTDNEAIEFFEISEGGVALCEAQRGGVQRAPTLLKRSIPSQEGMRRGSKAFTILDTYSNISTHSVLDDCTKTRASWFWLNIETGEKRKYRCGSWRCVCCESINRWKMKNRILEVCFIHKCQYFTTLTIPTWTTKEGKESFNYCSKAFNKLGNRIRRKYGAWNYIRINESTKKGYAHLHIIHKERLNVNWLRKSWVECGGGKMMKLEVIGSKKIEGKGHYKTDFEGLTAYLTSYLSKANLQLPKGVRHWSSNLKKVKTEGFERAKGVWVLRSGEDKIYIDNRIGLLYG